jgi:type 1 fimbriae regulatory protein FimB
MIHPKNPRKRHERSREHLTPEEVTGLLKASKETRHPERDYCLALLMVRHGLRASEACQLKLSDIHLTQKNLYVERQKNGISTTHPLFNGEVKTIRDWLAKRARMINGHSDPGTLFISERRTPFSRSMVWHIIKDCAEVAGLADLCVHPHMLRHATGYDMANRGMETRGIQQYLGHTNIQHTVKYTTLSPNRFKNVTWSF